jgi:ribose transport system permease protein
VKPGGSTASRRERFLRLGLPLAILSAIVVALFALPLYADRGITSYSIYNAFQNSSTLGFLALAVGLTIIIGELDLSSLGMFALGGMLAVKFGDTSPLLGIFGTIAVGAVLGLVQGILIARSGISSVPVTLGGYIALLGLCYIIGSGNTLVYTNLDAGLWLDSKLGYFFSPRSLVALFLFLIAGFVIRWTRVGRDIRAVGADRRAARAAGVHVEWIIVGVFLCSGSLSALGGALFTISTSAAKPDLGLAPLIFAVTAVLLGGVSLLGGRGGPGGILIGVLSLSLLETLFALLGTPSYVVNLVRGGLLLLVVVFEASDLRRAVIALRARAGERGLFGGGLR